MPTRPFACSAFEVDPRTREIQRDGVAQAVQPKVFDLLMYLIAHRHRVVSKTELLGTVWAGVVVSENVVARAVMKARQAIGDTGEPARMIRTVQRIGYRFDAAETAASKRSVTTADLPATTTPAAVVSSGPAACAEPVHIALLPMENRIADPQFAWVSLGLASLVAQAFEFDARFAVISFGRLLESLETLEPTGTEERCDQLGASLGAHCIVHCAVRRDGERFLIDLTGYGPRGRGMSRCIEGRELTELGQSLAHAIEAHLFPEEGSLLHFESSDTLVMQAYEHALQAKTERRFGTALSFLDVVLDIEPSNTPALLLQLQVMMNSLDPRAQEAGERLLKHAAWLGSARVEAQAHASLAMLSLILHGPGEDTLHHAGEAMRLTGVGRCDAASLRIYGINGVIAQNHGDHVSARTLLEHCIARHRDAGDLPALALVQLNLASTDIHEGQLGTARQRLMEALAFQREHGSAESVLTTLSNLAVWVNAALGDWALALEQCDEACRLILRVQRPRKLILQIASASNVYAEFARPACIDRMLDHLRERPTEDGEPLHAAVLVVRALRAMAAGQFESARAPLQRALEIQRKSRFAPYIQRGASLLLRNEALCGRHAEACAKADELFVDEPALHDLDTFPGLRLHLSAAHLHAQGRHEAAAERLDEAIHALPIGLADGHARLDAAWLALERGDAARAQALLRGMRLWLRDHPVGIAVSARLKFAHGGIDEALDLQLRCLRLQEVPRSYFVALRDFYARAGGAPGIAPAPSLLSLLPA